jgi:hypothetical protein
MKDFVHREMQAGAGVIGGGSAVTRTFGPGAVLNYDCTVFGKVRLASLDMQVRVFRGAIVQSSITSTSILLNRANPAGPAGNHNVFFILFPVI